MSDGSLREIFLRHCGSAVGGAEGLEADLRNAVKRARLAWPRLDIAADTFVAFVAKRVSGESPTRTFDPVNLEGVFVSDLYLACGCLHEDQTALEGFHSMCADRSPRVLRRARLNGVVEADDLMQALSCHLLLPDGGGGEKRQPRLALYSGRGPLSRWIDVAAVRLATRLARRILRDQADGDDRLAESVIGAGASEHGLRVEDAYVGEFRAAFGTVMEALEHQDRTLLRLYYLDGACLESLARLYHVHVSTVSRRIARIRERVLQDVAAEMRACLGVSGSEVWSIIRAIRSHVDVSLRRYLQPQGHEPAAGGMNHEPARGAGA